MYLSPILITAFARPELLAKCLGSILNQTIKPPKVLAFVDGPRNAEESKLVKECITQFERFNFYIPTEITVQSSNLGCDRHSILALSNALNVCESVIYLEDDVILNNCFYACMSKVLTEEAHRDDIFSVSGYSILPKEIQITPDKDWYLTRRFFSMASGFWQRKWRDMGFDRSFVQGGNLFGSFAAIPPTVETQRTILNQFFLEKNGTHDWAITMGLYCFAKEKVHICPRKSMVKNEGFGHELSKTYKGAEPSWANARFDPDFVPGQLLEPLTLDPIQNRVMPLHEFFTFLSKFRGVWLSPADFRTYWKKAKNLKDKICLSRFFVNRLPDLLLRYKLGKKP